MNSRITKVTERGENGRQSGLNFLGPHWASASINCVSHLVSTGVMSEQIKSLTEHQQALSLPPETLFFSKTGILGNSVVPLDDDRMLTFYKPVGLLFNRAPGQLCLINRLPPPHQRGLCRQET